MQRDPAPECPNCGAHDTKHAVYGLLMSPPEPWQQPMGCVVDGRRATWFCGACEHQW